MPSIVKPEAKGKIKGGFEMWRETWMLQFLRDRKLPHATKTVLTRLALRLNQDSRVAFPGVRSLAKETGMEYRNLPRTLKPAVERGHLKIEEQEPVPGCSDYGTKFYVPLVHKDNILDFAKRKRRNAGPASVLELARAIGERHGNVEPA